MELNRYELLGILAEYLRLDIPSNADVSMPEELDTDTLRIRWVTKTRRTE